MIERLKRGRWKRGSGVAGESGGAYLYSAYKLFSTLLRGAEGVVITDA